MHRGACEQGDLEVWAVKVDGAAHKISACCACCLTNPHDFVDLGPLIKRPHHTPFIHRLGLCSSRWQLAANGNLQIGDGCH